MTTPTFKPGDRVRQIENRFSYIVRHVHGDCVWVGPEAPPPSNGMLVMAWELEPLPPAPKHPTSGVVRARNTESGTTVTSYFRYPPECPADHCELDIDLLEWRRLKAREAAEAKGWLVHRTLADSSGRIKYFVAHHTSVPTSTKHVDTRDEAIDEMIRLSGEGGGG